MSILSVIIPMFNVEETIVRCLKPLLEATVPVEIICVDDGSTDQTRHIVKEISNNDSRVIYISQNNSGPGVARNKGLQIAKSKYIIPSLA